MADDILYQAFLEELRDLAEFRMDYTMDQPDAALEWEDPDARRLLEALAFFGARTQLASQRNIEATRRRLLQQFFPYLLSPLPSMVMVQAKPTGQLTETLSFPQATELVLQPERSTPAVFQTLRPLRVLPLQLLTVKQDPLPNVGTRLLLSFQAAYALNEQPGTLSLFVNYLNDFLLSLKLFHYLQTSLRSVRVQFGVYDEEQVGEDCPFSLGSPPAGVSDDEWRHPLEDERDYFHFPQQALYLDIELPEAPRHWVGFTLMLDCASSWPRAFRLNREIFQLFTTPLLNGQRAFASPLICDGLQERYAIRHPQPDFGYALRHVLGVYEVTEQGMIPFRPGILAGGNGSYEIEQGPALDGGGHLYWLLPHFPDAFERRRVLSVEAMWLQPRYDRHVQSNQTVRAFRRQTPGVKWELLDSPIPHDSNRQLERTAGYLHLLTLMHKSCLSGQDIRDVLNALGSVASGRFERALRDLTDVRIEEEPSIETGGRLSKHIYFLCFKTQTDDSQALLEAFAVHVGRVLDLWIADAQVEARIDFADAEAL